MSWVQRLVKAVGLRREATPREVLDAHLQVLLERFARDSNGSHIGGSLDADSRDGGSSAGDSRDEGSSVGGSSNGDSIDGGSGSSDQAARDQAARDQAARDGMTDRRAAAPSGTAPTGSSGAGTVHEAGYHVQVEAGLTHLRVVAERANRLSVELPLDAFLTQCWTQRELDQRAAALGFQREGRAWHYALRRPAGSKRERQQFVGLIERVLHELLGLPPQALYTVSIEQDRELDNAPLLESFRELARRRDTDSRRLVYQGLINARLLLPLRGDDDAAPFPAVETLRGPGSQHDSWVAFTDREALRDYRDPPEPFVSVSGVRLVQALRVRQIAGLQLNPRSRVGGELLPNEIDMLADYLDSLGLLAVPVRS